MNRMGKLDCLDLDRIDGTPRLRSRSNSINRVQSETRCEDKVRLELLLGLSLSLEPLNNIETLLSMIYKSVMNFFPELKLYT